MKKLYLTQFRGIVCLVILLLAGATFRSCAPAGEKILVPAIDGEWWQLTGYQPGIEPYKYDAGDNQVCDFTIFQAADLTWQLIACVRGNNYPGSHRFLYRWEAGALNDTMWEEKGIFQSTGTGDKPDGFGTIYNKELYPAIGLLQAPYCIVEKGTYFLFYNNRNAMCKTSTNGKEWKDLKSDKGTSEFFEMGRDLMIFDDRMEGGKWIAYYTSGRNYPQYMEARTCATLTGTWSEGTMVYDGWSNTRNPIYRNEFAESPFVIRYDGHYYLFAQMHVFISEDPMDFTKNRKVANLESSRYEERAWAPEIIKDKAGNYYIAAYRPKGIFMAKLKFVESYIPVE